MDISLKKLKVAFFFQTLPARHRPRTKPNFKKFQLRGSLETQRTTPIHTTKLQNRRKINPVHSSQNFLLSHKTRRSIKLIIDFQIGPIKRKVKLLVPNFQFSLSFLGFFLRFWGWWRRGRPRRRRRPPGPP